MPSEGTEEPPADPGWGASTLTAEPDPPGGAGSRTAVGLMGMFAALAAGALTLFTVGAGPAIAVAAAIGIMGFATALAAPPGVVRGMLGALVLVLVGSLAIGGWGLSRIVSALGERDGVVDAPDGAALSAAEDKLDVASRERGFRVELTEDELTAVLQDALATSANPFRSIDIDITNDLGERGAIDFVGEFKSGDLDIVGSLETTVQAGRLMLTIVDIEVGMFRVPSVGRAAVEDMIEELADFQAALAADGAEVQQIVIGDDRIIVSGTNSGSADIDMSSVVDGIERQVDLSGFVIRLDEDFPPGTATSNEVPGNTYYVALGDSLAANVGVQDIRDGYVSRFHLQLEERDGRTYGLRNFGVVGETSRSLLDGGQLDAAIEFARTNEVAYVTIDIGANDLLGHLGSEDCSEDVAAPACLERVGGALEAYEFNVTEIFGRLAEGFPKAEVIVLLTYNPFSFGFEDSVEFEAQSNQVIRRLNTIARLAGEERGFVVADGFTPMVNTATATTHMLDDPPDIHPTGLGYDRLTGALVDAIS